MAAKRWGKRDFFAAIFLPILPRVGFYSWPGRASYNHLGQTVPLLYFVLGSQIFGDASNWKEGWLSKRAKRHSDTIRVDWVRHEMPNDYWIDRPQIYRWESATLRAQNVKRE